MSFLSSVTNSLNRVVQSMTLSPEEIRVRKQIASICNMVKIASLITAIVAAIFFLSFPYLGNLLLATLVNIACFDGHKVATNLERVVQNPMLEATLRVSSLSQNLGLLNTPAVVDYITDKTIVAKSLSKIFEQKLQTP